VLCTECSCSNEIEVYPFILVTLFHRRLAMASYEAVGSSQTPGLAHEQRSHAAASFIYPPQLASDRLEALAVSSDTSSDSGYEEVDVEKHSLLFTDAGAELDDDLHGSRSRSSRLKASSLEMDVFAVADALQ
jgi:hypothetical protein